MVGQGSSGGPVGALTLSDANLGFELFPREELISDENFFKWSKFYPRQFAKTFLKGFFELNPATVSDPGHTTTSLSANQMIQFARAVGVEVTFASYGLLQDILIRSQGISAVGLRGVAGRLP